MNFNLEDLKNQEAKLLESLNMMDDKLCPKKSPDAGDIDGIIGYGIEIANMAGNSAKAVADAKELLLNRELIYMSANEQLWDKPTVLKKLMDGSLAVNHKYVIWSDRINAAIAHKLDFYRSIVSKYKEELKLTQMQEFNARRTG